MPIRRLKRVVSNISGPEWRNQSRGLTIGKELREFRRVFKNNFITLIVSAFGVVAALSWNEAIKEVILVMFPSKGALVAKLYTAFAVTLISIVVAYLLSKLKTQNGSN